MDLICIGIEDRCIDRGPDDGCGSRWLRISLLIHSIKRGCLIWRRYVQGRDLRGRSNLPYLVYIIHLTLGIRRLLGLRLDLSVAQEHICLPFIGWRGPIRILCLGVIYRGDMRVAESVVDIDR